MIFRINDRENKKNSGKGTNLHVNNFYNNYIIFNFLSWNVNDYRNFSQCLLLKKFQNDYFETTCIKKES